MQTAILEAHPGAALSVFVVWVPVLESDDMRAAQAVVHLIGDGRAGHFYDTLRRIASAVAASLGGESHVAWDCYLFYPAGARWGRTLPPPERWVHQLGPGTWADPGRYRWGDELKRELRSAAADLLERPRGGGEGGI